MNKKDLEFSQAMKTKLRLNREQLAQKGSEVSVQDNAPSETTEDFSSSIIQRAMQRHPGLTKKEAQEMLDFLGITFSPNPTILERYKEAGLNIPVVNKVDPATSAKAYSDDMTTAMADHPLGPQVTIQKPENLQDAKLYRTEFGGGFAIKPDGDVIGVFQGANAPPKTIYATLQLAIQQGGKKLDAFNTMLPDIYETVGFKPVSKIAWDDTQAPDGWSKEKFAKYNNGEPDLVFFVYDPNYFGGVNIDDLPVSSTYDEAQSIQTKALQNLGDLMGRFDNVFDILNKFGQPSETRIYGGDLPEKIERMGNKIVVPESKDSMDEIVNLFAPKKGKEKGMKLGRIGEIFDKNFDALDDQLVNIIGKPGDILQNLKAMNAELFEEARRGTMTLQDIAKQAGEIGFDKISETLMLRKPGQMLNPAEVFGGIILIQKLDQELMYGIDKLKGRMGDVQSGNIDPKIFSDKQLLEDYAKIQRLMEMSKTVTAQLGGGVSEGGRVLSVVSKIEQVLDVDFRTIDEKYEGLAQTTVDDIVGQNGRNKIAYELQTLSALNFRQRQSYVQNSPVKKSIDIIMEMYINALLSSPVTHSVNVAGNGVFQVMRVLETGVAGVIGNTRQAIRKGLGMRVDPEDMTMAIEAYAHLHGSLMAQKDAFTLMAKTLITGESGDIQAKFGKIDLERIGIGPKTKFDKDGNVTVQATNNVVEIMEQASRGELGGAFLNTIGVATRLPGRFLAMEDEYFKVMIKRRVQYQEAFRASAIEIQRRVQAGVPLRRTPDMEKPVYNDQGELIKGELSAQEYGTAIYKQVLTNPSKEVRNRMTETALKETFQAPTGDGFARIFGNPAVKFLGVPFYKTPTNIIKEIGDRTLNVFPTARAFERG